MFRKKDRPTDRKTRPDIELIRNKNPTSILGEIVDISSQMKNSKICFESVTLIVEKQKQSCYQNIQPKFHGVIKEVDIF